MYSSEDGHFKGDALITYFKPESVQLAVEMLDDSEIRSGCKIKVEEAKFETNNANAKKPKKHKPSKKQKIYDQKKELSWDEDENRHIIIKHMFEPSESYVSKINLYQFSLFCVRIPFHQHIFSMTTTVRSNFLPRSRTRYPTRSGETGSNRKNQNLRIQSRRGCCHQVQRARASRKMCRKDERALLWREKIRMLFLRWVCQLSCGRE